MDFRTDLSQMTNYTNEQTNLSSSLVSQPDFSDDFKVYEEIGSESMHTILSEEKVDLVFTREYEHAVGLISSQADFEISYFALPHPSGVAVGDNSIFIFSTRTPHMLVEFKKANSYNMNDTSTYLIPDHIRILPGSLYAHELVERDGYLYFNATGHNDVRRIPSSLKGSMESVFKPNFIQKSRSNCMQLNSLSFESDKDAFSTCFSACDSNYKPWKDSEGPRGKGAIIRHSDSHILVSNLTCPHSVRVIDNHLYFCNSGFGELNTCNMDGSDCRVIESLPGFTRGLAVSKNYFFIGLSRIQKGKSSYAPGIDPETSHCGIAAIKRSTGEVSCLLSWTNGQQIFDIQLLDVKDYQFPRFPQSRLAGSSEPADLFYNWKESS